MTAAEKALTKALAALRERLSLIIVYEFAKEHGEAMRLAQRAEARLKHEDAAKLAVDLMECVNRIDLARERRKVQEDAFDAEGKAEAARVKSALDAHHAKQEAEMQARLERMAVARAAVNEVL